MEELIELKFIFKQMLKVSAFYLGKQKSLGRCQYQNKKALFTDSIFREGFGPTFRVKNVPSRLNSRSKKGYKIYVHIVFEWPLLDINSRYFFDMK